MRRQQGTYLALFTVAVWLLTTAASALAISAPIHISGTDGEGVFVRPDPSTANPAVGWMPEGASPDYNCFVWGQNIGGVPIWFNVNYNGKTGYYASYYDDSSYHSNEELTAKYGVPLCGSTAPPPPSSPTPTPAPPTGGSPSGGPIYTIVDADGGVYFRNAPEWSETSATAGKGVYLGDQVQVICGAFGEAYGPYSNRWWSYVQNLSRPTAGKGWVNAHFINDGMPANQPSPGEGVCPATVPGAPAAGAGGSMGASSTKSVFYWPQLSVPERPTGTPFLGVADMDVDYPVWHVNGGCNASWPIPLFIPETVNTLAGWSRSRLAPVYFLSDFPGRRSQIRNIILFDPGSYSEMQGGCDETLRPSVNSVLANWLKSNQPARLTILAGALTDETDVSPKPTYHGLWNFYLHDIWALSSSVRSRVKVCDYAKLTHPDVLNDFFQAVKAVGAGQDNGCPVSANAPKPAEWSP
jgi:uncharacterized protein YraI